MSEFAEPQTPSSSPLLLKFLAHRWFLLALVAVLAIGFFFAEPLAPVAKSKALSNGIVVTVLLLMSLPLSFSTVSGTVRRPWPVLLGTVVNAGLVPVLAWGGSFFLPGDLGIGLLIAGAVPSTLASGAVWTRRAGGNDAVAMMVTVITNLACFLVMPAWLLLTTSTSITLKPGEMVVSIALLVVAPIFVAQALRLLPRVGSFATRHKVVLGVFAQLGILSMIGIGAIHCGQKLESQVARLVSGETAVMIFVVMAVHLLALASGMWVALRLKIAWPDAIAVGISGSQKTLMIGLWASTQYFGGLTLLPLIVYHVGQLLADTVIADRLRLRHPSKID